MFITSVGAFAHWVYFVVVCAACWCRWSPGGPRSTENRHRCCSPCRGGCHSYRCSSCYPSYGISSSYDHSESGAVSDAPSGHSGHTRYQIKGFSLIRPAPAALLNLTDLTYLLSFIQPQGCSCNKGSLSLQPTCRCSDSNSCSSTNSSRLLPHRSKL